MGRIILKDTDVPPALRSIDVKAVLRRRGIYLKQRQNAELYKAAIPLATKLIKGQVKKGKKTKEVIEVVPPQKYLSFNDEQVAGYVSKQIHSVETLEKHLDAAIKRYLLNTLLAKCLDNLSNMVNDTKAVKTKRMVFDEADKTYLINQAKIELGPLLQNMAVIAGQEANGLLDVKDPYVPSDALRKRVEGNVSKFTESMVETDQEHLSSLIIAGIDDGKGVPEISSAIKSEFTDYSANQATRITRTEVLRSANQSAVDAFKQSGVVEGKQWVIHGAEDDCASYDGEIVTLDGNFYTGGNDFQDGDPPLHPNCKCIVIPVLSQDDSSKALMNDIQRVALKARIAELESKADKRTKAFKELKAKSADDKVYIKALERHLSIDDESSS